MLKKFFFKLFYDNKYLDIFSAAALPWFFTARKNDEVALRTSFTSSMCRCIKKAFVYALKTGFLCNISVLLCFMFLLNIVSSTVIRITIKL